MIYGDPQEGTSEPATHHQVSVKEGDPCVLDQKSGPRRLLEVIGDKWSILVVYALESGTLRFNALERALPGVSQKVLAQTLKRMEFAGLVTRQAFAEVPLRVEYRLTTLGATLAPVTIAICQWADAHAGDLRPARAGETGDKSPAEGAQGKPISRQG